MALQEAKLKEMAAAAQGGQQPGLPAAAWGGHGTGPACRVARSRRLPACACLGRKAAGAAPTVHRPRPRRCGRHAAG